MPEKHALYAVCRTATGLDLTFRVGQPVGWVAAMQRWTRLDARLNGIDCPAREVVIRWARRKYSVRYFEVRSVDANGRGLGSERHEQAFPVPYRLARSGR